MSTRDPLRESVLPRAWRDTKAFSVSFRGQASAVLAGLLLSVLAYLPGAQELISSAAIGLGGWMFVLLAAFAFILAATPVRQRDEAREELQDLMRKRAAPLVLSMAFDPPSPVTVQGRWTEVRFALRIRNDHPDDIAGAVLQIEAPATVTAQRMDSPGKPYSGDGPMFKLTADDRCAWEGEIKLRGGGWPHEFWTLLTLAKPGTYEITARVRLPGFDSVTRTFKLEANSPS